MFLKTGKIKEVMKAALKAGGLTVGNYDNHYLVCTNWWGVWVDCECATNKFKAAIMEVVGELPVYETCCLFSLREKEIFREGIETDIDPYENWKAAKDFAKETPIVLRSYPHELSVFQRHSNGEYIACLKSHASDLFSSAELEELEHIPKQPDVSPDGNCLYFKSETMIYWICRIDVSEKVKERLFQRLEGLDFSEEDWLRRIDETENEEPDETLLY